jgi:hypothetical protein
LSLSATFPLEGKAIFGRKLLKRNDVKAFARRTGQDFQENSRLFARVEDASADRFALGPI